MFYQIPHSLAFSLPLILFYLTVIFLVSELLNRFKYTDAEFTRKVVHIGSGNIILLAWWLDVPTWVGLSAATIAAIVALASYYLPILPSINSVGRQSLGTFFYAVSFGVLVAYFWPLKQPYFAAIGVLTMAWGDGLAAVIGQRFGKHPYQVFGMRKSWEGSLTMTLVAYLVVSLVLGLVTGSIWPTCLIALVVAIAATGLEAISQLGIDNCTVPLGSAMLAFWLTKFWG